MQHSLANLLALAAVLCASTTFASVSYPSWNYGMTDAQWAALRASDNSLPFAACGGSRQSPVDLVGVVGDATLKPLAPAWAPFGTFAVRDIAAASTVQVDLTAASAPTFRDPNTGKTYSLLQFHFHSPSEHSWSGAYRDLEVHLVHQHTDGTLLVVGVSFVASPYGTNTFLNQFWTNIVGLPKDGRVPRSVPLNFTDAVPVNPTYTTYPGSLTVPPCEPIVTWYVMDEAISVSRDQLDAIRTTLGFAANDATAFQVSGNNRRRQPIAGRTLRRYVEGGEIAALDSKDLGTGPGQLAIAAIAIAAVALVLALAAGAMYAMQPATVPGSASGKAASSSAATKTQEMREKQKLVGAQV